MSPTYWTASRLKMAAREHGWEIVPTTAPGMVPGEVWGFRKQFGTRTLTIRIKENRRGGLVWATLTTTFDGGADVTRRGPDYRGKCEAVIAWLRGENQ